MLCVLVQFLLTTIRLLEQHDMKEQQSDAYKMNNIKVLGQFSIEREKRSHTNVSIGNVLCVRWTFQLRGTFMCSCVVRYRSACRFYSHKWTRIAINWKCCRTRRQHVWVFVDISMSARLILVYIHVYVGASIQVTACIGTLYFCCSFRCCYYSYVFAFINSEIFELWNIPRVYTALICFAWIFVASLSMLCVCLMFM